jgi:hypothetical protein
VARPPTPPHAGKRRLDDAGAIADRRFGGGFVERFAEEAGGIDPCVGGDDHHIGGGDGLIGQGIPGTDRALGFDLDRVAEFLAACSSPSAAMMVWAMPVGQEVTATIFAMF